MNILLKQGQFTMVSQLIGMGWLVVCLDCIVLKVSCSGVRIATSLWGGLGAPGDPNLVHHMSNQCWYRLIACMPKFKLVTLWIYPDLSYQLQLITLVILICLTWWEDGPKTDTVSGTLTKFVKIEFVVISTIPANLWK